MAESGSKGNTAGRYNEALKRYKSNGEQRKPRVFAVSGGVIGGGVALQGRYNLGGGHGKQPLKLGQNRRRAIGHFREKLSVVSDCRKQRGFWRCCSLIARLSCLPSNGQKKIEFLIIKDKKSRGFVAGFLLIIGAAFLLLVFAFVC